MKLDCIVLAHRAPRQLALLLAALRHPQVQVYLHLDRRARLAPFSRALSDAGVNDAFLLPRRVTRWGGIEIVDAALDALGRGVADRCRYFVLISGQDFPLRPVEEILVFMEKAGSRSYVDHFALPTERWRFGGRDRTDFYTYNLLGRRETCIPRGEDTSFFSWRGHVLNGLLRMRGARAPVRSFPPYLRPFGGSQWWNLSREAAEHVLGFVDEHPDYRRYHKHTLLPDELFFQSILLGTDFTVSHEIVGDPLRFMVWPEGSRHPRHPRTLDAGDLPAMEESRDLFARKLDAAVDETVLARLAERVAA
jgi:Core-2/I-Branching enzyme